LTVDCYEENESCYITRRSRRWFEARNNCTAENADLAVLTPDIYQLLHTRNVIITGARYYIGLRKVYLQWTGPGPSKYELDRRAKHIRYILDVHLHVNYHYCHPRSIVEVLPNTSQAYSCVCYPCVSYWFVVVYCYKCCAHFVRITSRHNASSIASNSTQIYQINSVSVAIVRFKRLHGVFRLISLCSDCDLASLWPLPSWGITPSRAITGRTTHLYIKQPLIQHISTLRLICDTSYRLIN